MELIHSDIFEVTLAILAQNSHKMGNNLSAHKTVTLCTCSPSLSPHMLCLSSICFHFFTPHLKTTMRVFDRYWSTHIYQCLLHILHPQTFILSSFPSYSFNYHSLPLKSHPYFHWYFEQNLTM